MAPSVCGSMHEKKSPMVFRRQRESREPRRWEQDMPVMRLVVGAGPFLRGMAGVGYNVRSTRVFFSPRVPLTSSTRGSGTLADPEPPSRPRGKRKLFRCNTHCDMYMDKHMDKVVCVA